MLRQYVDGCQTASDARVIDEIGSRCPDSSDILKESRLKIVSARVVYRLQVSSIAVRERIGTLFRIAHTG